MGHFPITCKSVVVITGNQVLETEDAFSPTFLGGVTAPTLSYTSMAKRVAQRQIGRSDPRWHIQLKIQHQDMKTRCTDTRAQVSVMPEAMYKSLYRMISKSDRELGRAGDVLLVTLGSAVMNLTLAVIVTKEQVYLPSEVLALSMKSRGRTVPKRSVRCLITIHSHQEQRRSLSSSTLFEGLRKLEQTG